MPSIVVSHAAAVLAVAAAPGADTTAPTSGAIAYPAEFFAQARPNNAFEMLQRLPGFSLVEGDADVRGFGGAAGNVLVDGKRPASKSVSLEAALRRIPATAVLRVEVIRGSIPGIDMQGHAVVANVIRSSASATQVFGTAGVQAYGDRLRPRAEVELSRQSDALALDGAIRAFMEADSDGGRGWRTRFLPTGAIIDSGRFGSDIRDKTVEANGSATLTRASDSLRLTVGAIYEDQQTRLDAQPFSGPRFVGHEETLEDALDRRLEFGLDYQRSFGGGLSAKLIGLQTLGDTRRLQTDLDPAGQAEAEEDSRTRESVLRAIGTLVASPALTFEVGGEGALNVLDSVNRLEVDGTTVALPNASVRVAEKRGELFGTTFYAVTDALKLELGARAEASTITQSGDTDMAVSFFFLKPRLRATYNFGANTQFRFRIEREVGQLDFGDFAASAELESNIVNAGNADLQPERSWVVEAGVEQRFWGRGAVAATYRHAEVQKVVDRVPIGDDFDAPGNIGAARRDEVQAIATIPLERLGLSGALLTSDVTWRWSRVTDPLTRLPRRISDERPIEGEVRFSQDLTRLRSTWGVNGSFGFRATTYRLDEVRRTSADAQWTVYWDWKPSPTRSVRAEVQNLSGRDQRRHRTLYNGSRRFTAVEAGEIRNIRFRPAIFVRWREAL